MTKSPGRGAAGFAPPGFALQTQCLEGCAAGQALCLLWQRYLGGHWRSPATKLFSTLQSLYVPIHLLTASCYIPFKVLKIHFWVPSVSKDGILLLPLNTLLYKTWGSTNDELFLHKSLDERTEGTGPPSTFKLPFQGPWLTATAYFTYFVIVWWGDIVGRNL